VKRVLVVIALCAVALLATACGERGEPTGASVRLYPVTVDGATGPPTTLERAPRRILAAGRQMAETLAALGVETQVVQLQRTGGEIGGAADQLVLAWASSPEADDLDRRTQGLPVYIAADGTIDEVERSLDDIGVLVGEPLSGRQAAAAIERRVTRVRDAVSRQRLVTVFLDRGFRTTYSTRSLQGDMLRAAGGYSVAGASLEQLDSKTLLRLNPRVYLATSDSGTTLKSLEDDRTLKRLPAVKSHQFGIVPAQTLEPGPRIGEGVAAIARRLHPDAFR
jgi:ABC-type Fe3+-hydroxamate transport system substrate-binding protein